MAPGVLCSTLEQPLAMVGANQLQVQLVCALDTFGCQGCHIMQCPWFVLHANA